MQAPRKCWRHYGKLWPLENQALDFKQRASLLENHIPSESLFETSMTKNCCFIRVPKIFEKFDGLDVGL